VVDDSPADLFEAARDIAEREDEPEVTVNAHQSGTLTHGEVADGQVTFELNNWREAIPDLEEHAYRVRVAHGGTATVEDRLWYRAGGDDGPEPRAAGSLVTETVCSLAVESETVYDATPDDRNFWDPNYDGPKNVFGRLLLARGGDELVLEAGGGTERFDPWNGPGYTSENVGIDRTTLTVTDHGGQPSDYIGDEPGCGYRYVTCEDDDGSEWNLQASYGIDGHGMLEIVRPEQRAFVQSNREGNFRQGHLENVFLDGPVRPDDLPREESV